MDAVKKISPAKLDMLRLLLKDPKIASCVVVDGIHAGEIVVTDEGDIKLGRTKIGWVNSMFNMYTIIEFPMMASKIAAVITGCVKKSNDDMVGIVQEIIEKTILTDNREEIIDLLFQYVVILDNESPYFSKYIGKSKIPDSIPLGQAFVDLGGQVIQVPVTLDKLKQVYWLG